MGSNYFDQVSEAAGFLRGNLSGLSPRIGIVLGSGLGAVAESVADATIVPYAEIPHFPQSTGAGHLPYACAGGAGDACCSPDKRCRRHSAGLLYRPACGAV